MFDWMACDWSKFPFMLAVREYIQAIYPNSGPCAIRKFHPHGSYHAMMCQHRLLDANGTEIAPLYVLYAS